MSFGILARYPQGGMRLRYLAEINPPTLEFERLPPDMDVTFLPLEAVWRDRSLDASRVKRKEEVSSGYTRFRDGDIIVPKITPTFQADRAAIVGGLHGGVGAGTTELHIVRPGPNLNPRYARYLLSSRPFLLGGEASMIGVAGQKRVPDDWLRDLVVPVPGVGEQRTIADFLDRETARIDALIDRKQRLSILLDERRRATICNGVRGLLGPAQVRDAGISWAPTVRAPWPGVMIKHFASLGTGHTPSRSRPELWVSAEIPWITTGEVKQVRNDRQEVIVETRECVSELGIANSAAELHPAGTVVLCRTASAGYSAIMGKDMATSQDFVAWTCSSHLLPRYLLMCLRAMRNDLLGRLAYGSTHKTIYWPDVESLKIPLPPVDEQADVLRQIDKSTLPLDSAHHRLTQQVQILREHRQTLITTAVTGQMAIPSAA